MVLGTDPGEWYPVEVVIEEELCKRHESAGMPIRSLTILYNIIAIKLILRVGQFKVFNRLVTQVLYWNGHKINFY